MGSIPSIYGLVPSRRPLPDMIGSGLTLCGSGQFLSHIQITGSSVLSILTISPRPSAPGSSEPRRGRHHDVEKLGGAPSAQFAARRVPILRVDKESDRAAPPRATGALLHETRAETSRPEPTSSFRARSVRIRTSHSSKRTGGLRGRALSGLKSDTWHWHRSCHPQGATQEARG